MINSIVFTKDKMIISKGTYSKKKVRIVKQIEVDYPENTYANDEILDALKLGHTIIAELKKHKIKTAGIIFAIQHSDINIVDLSVPYIKKRMQQAVNAKLSERYIGIMERNLISFKISKIEGNVCSGTAAIAPRSLIHAYYDLSMKMGMKLIGIDYMGNTLYKSIYHETKDIINQTFLIADMTSDEIIIHLYSDGLLRLSRSESGNMLLSNDEPVVNDFVFDNKLTITNDDIVDIKGYFKKIKVDLSDLSAFYSTKNVFFKRYSSDEAHGKEEVLAMENTLESIGNAILDMDRLIATEPDFTDINEQQMRDYFTSLLSYITKVSAFFKKTRAMSVSFADEVDSLIEVMMTNNQEIINILDKYIVNAVDQKKLERRKVIQRICQLANNVILVADTSGQYPDISNIYVQGMILDASEKRLVSQNLGKHYEVNCSYYENWIHKEYGIALGSLYNEYHYFHDFNLSETLEKNDKVNRNNYDNIIFGIGGSIAVGGVALALVTFFNMYSIQEMQKLIATNDTFIAQNQDVFDSVNKVKQLHTDIDEIQNFQSYFSASNVDIENMYYKLVNLSGAIKLDGIGIDENFLVTLNATSPELKDISVFTETLTKSGYKNVAYSNISNVEGGYNVQVTFTYTPDIAEKKE